MVTLTREVYIVLVFPNEDVPDGFVRVKPLDNLDLFSPNTPSLPPINKSIKTGQINPNILDVYYSLPASSQHGG